MIRLVLVLALFAIRGAVGTSTSSSSIAASSECDDDFRLRQRAASDKHIDSSVRPCNDFYEYACGNWRVPYQLRSLRAHDTLTGLKANNKHLLIRYFQQAAADADSLDHVAPHQRNAIAFYASCMEELAKTDGDDSIAAYAEALRRISDWPVLNTHYLESAANASFNWEYVSAQLRRYGVQSLWRLQVQPNWQTSEQRIFYITAPSFDMLTQGAPSPDEDSVFLYQRYVKYLMLELGIRVREALRIATEVVDFEQELMALTKAQEGSVVLKEPQTLETLARELPDVALMHYFETLMQNDGAAPPTVTPALLKQLLVVADTAYVRRLARFLQTVKSSTIGKYLLVQFLAHFEVNLHENDSYSEHTEHCLQQVHTFLPHELTTLFLELRHNGSSAAFLQRTKVHLHDIFERVKVQFETLLNATSIFDRDPLTRALGLEKLRAMRLHLPQLAPSYAGSYDFEIGADYNSNLMNLSRLRTRTVLAQVLRTLTPAAAFDDATAAASAIVVDSSYGPLDLNAYYRLMKNAIEIPIGILQLPLYDACLPPARIYGGFVYIIAHELLHGFDYDGLNYDKAGNVANDWDVKSIIKFGTKSTCYLSERYKNAALTINENIADSEGLQLTLATFTATADEGTARSEDDLKQFFLSFAQTWCGESTSSGNSLHATHKERVNNALGNFPQFAEVYRCGEGSPMHPEDKCRIW